ncbi:hypothetical protein U1Q18_051129, partial [Sarracenia purpurea var. burkii]
MPDRDGITPFDGTGYDTWSYRMRLLLRREGAELIIDGVPAQRNRTADWKKDDNN